MEPDHSVSSVYRSVIDDVVARVKPEFVGEGVDEAVLDELRVIWETKLTQSGALDTGPPVTQAPPPGPYGAPAHAYGQPLVYPYAAASASGLHVLPPLPAPPYGSQPWGQGSVALGEPQAHLHHPFPGAAPVAPGGQNGALGQPAAHPRHGAAGYGVPPSLAPAQAGGGGGGFAATGQASGGLKRKLEDTGSWPAGVVPAKHQAHAGAIPQQDGPADDAADAGAAGVVGSAAVGTGGAAVEGEPAEKRDTLSDVESDEAEEDKEYANVVVAQFEKVTRTKNRWKCTLKDGVMHLNGREFLFNRASGEMQF